MGGLAKDAISTLFELTSCRGKTIEPRLNDLTGVPAKDAASTSLGLTGRPDKTVGSKLDDLPGVLAEDPAAISFELASCGSGPPELTLCDMGRFPPIPMLFTDTLDEPREPGIPSLLERRRPRSLKVPGGSGPGSRLGSKGHVIFSALDEAEQ